MKKETRCAIVISLISFSFHLPCMFGSLLFLYSSNASMKNCGSGVLAWPDPWRRSHSFDPVETMGQKKVSVNALELSSWLCLLNCGSHVLNRDFFPSFLWHCPSSHGSDQIWFRRGTLGNLSQGPFHTHNNVNWPKKMNPTGLAWIWFGNLWEFLGASLDLDPHF
jgi:hypothetical protein